MSKILIRRHAEDISNLIKYRRKKLGWSLNILAEKIGYPNTQTVEKIENRNDRIPHNRIDNFAKVLGFDEKDFRYIVRYAYNPHWETVKDFVEEYIGKGVYIDNMDTAIEESIIKAQKSLLKKSGYKKREYFELYGEDPDEDFSENINNPSEKQGVFEFISKLYEYAEKIIITHGKVEIIFKEGVDIDDILKRFYAGTL